MADFVWRILVADFVWRIFLYGGFWWRILYGELSGASFGGKVRG